MKGEGQRQPENSHRQTRITRAAWGLGLPAPGSREIILSQEVDPKRLPLWAQHLWGVGWLGHGTIHEEGTSHSAKQARAQLFPRPARDSVGAPSPTAPSATAPPCTAPSRQLPRDSPVNWKRQTRTSRSVTGTSSGKTTKPITKIFQ